MCDEHCMEIGRPNVLVMTFSRCISGTTLSNIHAWKLVHIMTVCVYMHTYPTFQYADIL